MCYVCLRDHSPALVLDTATFAVSPVAARMIHFRLRCSLISVSFSLSKTTTAIIVVSQLDVRYFKGVAPPCYWNFDFVLFKRGQKEPVDTSSHSRFTCRSVSLEFQDLDEGEYIAHVSTLIGIPCRFFLTSLKCRLDKVPFSDKVRPSQQSPRVHPI